MGGNHRVSVCLDNTPPSDRQKKNDRNIDAVLIDCANCGHCVDYKPERANEAQELKDARTAIRAAFKKWLSSP